jgi:hypothetical protein
MTKNEILIETIRFYGEWVHFACRGLSAKTPMGKLEAKASELLAAWDFAVKHNRDRLIQAQ